MTTRDRRLALTGVALLSAVQSAAVGGSWLARWELRSALVHWGASVAWIGEALRRALGGDAALPHEPSP